MLGLMLSFLLCAVPSQTEPNEQQPQEPERNPPALHETIVVTATGLEEPLSETISLVSVLTAEDLQAAPALTLDDRLRRIPGFSTFRRSSSLIAHPTTQGVSLRGIGPSGAGRSLVLFDGLPLNDPFGGWVYWNRYPALSLRAAEISRGATSQLYGSSALGGTIQLFPREAEKGTLEVSGQLADPQSYDLDAFASDKKGDWGYIASGRLFDTHGYFVIDEEQRGAVDRPAHSEFQSFFGRVFYKNFHAGLNVFREERGNGTALQQNQSRIYLFEAGIQGDSWEAAFYTQSTVLESTFSRILPDRSQEFLTAEQRFPSTGVGGSFSWHSTSGLLVGTDWRRASWEDTDQNLFGIFIQDLLELHPRLDLLLGTRLDVWQNRETQTSVNPRLGLLYRAADQITLRATGYRGFRAPTLNELYRPFRVGNIETLNNPDLSEEQLWGGETGVDFHPNRNTLVRVNVFWNSLRDPVSNITLSVSPGLILRQRQNVGSANIRGVELESILRPHFRWELYAAYLYSRAVFGGTDLRLPQVPLHQASFGVSYLGPLRVNVQSRWIGDQFEDDLNQLPLGEFAVLDVRVSRNISEHLDLFMAVENLLDREYAVGRTPVETLGTPRLIHGGLRIRLTRR